VRDSVTVGSETERTSFASSRPTVYADSWSRQRVSGSSSAQSARLKRAVLGTAKNLIVGTPGPDVLRGTPGQDRIEGRGGNDIIRGRGGDDILCGGDGADTIYGGAGGPELPGFEESPNYIRGGAGRDRLYGGAGQDFIREGRGADKVFAGAGDDILEGWSRGNDRIHLGPGSDTLTDSRGRDVVFGGRGDDSFGLGRFGHAGHDVFHGDAGSDLVFWSGHYYGPSAIIDLTAGRVRTVNGSEELRSIENASGTRRGDTLIGNVVANVLNAWWGNDHIEGGAGDDELDGARGVDVLNGGDGTDTCVDGETLNSCEL
jgi:Ca2+-binding RTX toxin-like protein